MCAPCAAAAKAARNKQQQQQAVRQLPQRTVSTPSAQKQVDFRNRMKFAPKK